MHGLNDGDGRPVEEPLRWHGFTPYCAPSGVMTMVQTQFKTVPFHPSSTAYAHIISVRCHSVM